MKRQPYDSVMYLLQNYSKFEEQELADLSSIRINGHEIYWIYISHGMDLTFCDSDLSNHPQYNWILFENVL